MRRLLPDDDHTRRRLYCLMLDYRWEKSFDDLINDVSIRTNYTIFFSFVIRFCNNWLVFGVWDNCMKPTFPSTSFRFFRKWNPLVFQKVLHFYCKTWIHFKQWGEYQSIGKVKNLHENKLFPYFKSNKEKPMFFKATIFEAQARCVLRGELLNLHWSLIAGSLEGIRKGLFFCL